MVSKLGFAREFQERIAEDFENVNGTFDLIMNAPDNDLAGEEGGVLITFSAGLETPYERVDSAAKQAEKELDEFGVDHGRSRDDRFWNDPISGKKSKGPYIEIVTQEIPDAVVRRFG